MKSHAKAAMVFLTGFATLAATASLATGTQAQAGFPDTLRRYSDTGTVPFRIGAAITLQGGPSRCPVNGCQPWLLCGDPRDRAYRALVQGQCNQIEGGKRVPNSPYTPGDMRDKLQSYVQQVVDATPARNAAGRRENSSLSQQDGG